MFETAASSFIKLPCNESRISKTLTLIELRQYMPISTMEPETADTKSNVVVSSPTDLSNVQSDEEAPFGYGKEKCDHAGFWDHSMINIRLHVLKLWAKTGKMLNHSDANST